MSRAWNFLIQLLKPQQKISVHHSMCEPGTGQMIVETLSKYKEEKEYNYGNNNIPKGKEPSKNFLNIFEEHLKKAKEKFKIGDFVERTYSSMYPVKITAFIENPIKSFEESYREQEPRVIKATCTYPQQNQTYVATYSLHELGKIVGHGN